jgi:hypothetical protein
MLDTCRRQRSDVPLLLADEELKIRLIPEDSIANSVDQATRVCASTDPIRNHRAKCFQYNVDGLLQIAF